MYTRLFFAISLFLTTSYNVIAQDIPSNNSENGIWIIQGGWMMIPLISCSIIAVAFIFERFIAIRKTSIAPKNFIYNLNEALQQTSLHSAIELCQTNQSQLAKISLAIIKRGDYTRQEIQSTITDKIDHEFSNTQSRTKVLGVISGVAPLLGLMGTVLGMIKAFTVVAEQRAMGKGELLAGGISEALVTTAVGLGIAIPCYLFYHYFKAKLENIFRDMESDLIDFAVENKNLFIKQSENCD